MDVLPLLVVFSKVFSDRKSNRYILHPFLSLIVFPFREMTSSRTRTPSFTPSGFYEYLIPDCKVPTVSERIPYEVTESITR